MTCREVGRHCNTCRIFLEAGQTLITGEHTVTVEKEKKGHTTVYYKVEK
jgi:hypothetical protein